MLFLLMAIGLLSGLFQVIYGSVGLGRLIKYMPYPVVKDMQKYVDQTGLAPYKSAARVFDDIDEAKGWIENRILKEAAGVLQDTRVKDAPETPLELHAFDLFKGRKEETLAQLDAHLVRVRHSAGTKIYASGEVSEDLLFIRKGVVRFSVSIGGSRVRHLYSCGRGALFGEMTFLEGGVNSTDAIAVTDVELFVLSRKTFNTFAEQHKKAAVNLFEGLASVVTTRVRYFTSELVALES